MWLGTDPPKLASTNQQAVPSQLGDEGKEEVRQYLEEQTDTELSRLQNPPSVGSTDDTATIVANTAPKSHAKKRLRTGQARIAKAEDLRSLLDEERKTTMELRVQVQVQSTELYTLRNQLDSMKQGQSTSYATDQSRRVTHLEEQLKAAHAALQQSTDLQHKETEHLNKQISQLKRELEERKGSRSDITTMPQTDAHDRRVEAVEELRQIVEGFNKDLCATRFSEQSISTFENRWRIFSGNIHNDTKRKDYLIPYLLREVRPSDEQQRGMKTFAQEFKETHTVICTLMRNVICIAHVSAAREGVRLQDTENTKLLHNTELQRMETECDEKLETIAVQHTNELKDTTIAFEGQLQHMRQLLVQVQQQVQHVEQETRNKDEALQGLEAQQQTTQRELLELKRQLAECSRSQRGAQQELQQTSTLFIQVIKTWKDVVLAFYDAATKYAILAEAEDLYVHVIKDVPMKMADDVNSAMEHVPDTWKPMLVELVQKLVSLRDTLHNVRQQYKDALVSMRSREEAANRYMQVEPSDVKDQTTTDTTRFRGGDAQMIKALQQADREMKDHVKKWKEDVKASAVAEKWAHVRAELATNTATALRKNRDLVAFAFYCMTKALQHTKQRVDDVVQRSSDPEQVTLKYLRETLAQGDEKKKMRPSYPQFDTFLQTSSALNHAVRCFLFFLDQGIRTEQHSAVFKVLPEQYRTGSFEDMIEASYEQFVDAAVAETQVIVHRIMQPGAYGRQEVEPFISSEWTNESGIRNAVLQMRPVHQLDPRLFSSVADLRQDIKSVSIDKRVIDYLREHSSADYKTARQSADRDFGSIETVTRRLLDGFKSIEKEHTSSRDNLCTKYLEEKKQLQVVNDNLGHELNKVVQMLTMTVTFNKKLQERLHSYTSAARAVRKLLPSAEQDALLRSYEVMVKLLSFDEQTGHTHEDAWKQVVVVANGLKTCIAAQYKFLQTFADTNKRISDLLSQISAPEEETMSEDEEDTSGLDHKHNGSNETRSKSRGGGVTSAYYVLDLSELDFLPDLSHDTRRHWSEMHTLIDAAHRTLLRRVDDTARATQNAQDQISMYKSEIKEYQKDKAHGRQVVSTSMAYAAFVGRILVHYRAVIEQGWVALHAATHTDGQDDDKTMYEILHETDKPVELAQAYMQFVQVPADLLPDLSVYEEQRTVNVKLDKFMMKVNEQMTQALTRVSRSVHDRDARLEKIKKLIKDKALKLIDTGNYDMKIARLENVLLGWQTFSFQMMELVGSVPYRTVLSEHHRTAFLHELAKYAGALRVSSPLRDLEDVRRNSDPDEKGHIADVAALEEKADQFVDDLLSGVRLSDEEFGHFWTSLLSLVPEHTVQGDTNEDYSPVRHTFMHWIQAEGLPHLPRQVLAVTQHSMHDMGWTRIADTYLDQVRESMRVLAEHRSTKHRANALRNAVPTPADISLKLLSVTQTWTKDMDKQLTQIREGVSDCMKAFRTHVYKYEAKTRSFQTKLEELQRRATEQKQTSTSTIFKALADALKSDGDVTSVDVSLLSMDPQRQVRIPQGTNVVRPRRPARPPARALRTVAEEEEDTKHVSTKRTTDENNGVYVETTRTTTGETLRVVLRFFGMVAGGTPTSLDAFVQSIYIRTPPAPSRARSHFLTVASAIMADPNTNQSIREAVRNLHAQAQNDVQQSMDEYNVAMDERNQVIHALDSGDHAMVDTVLEDILTPAGTQALNDGWEFLRQSSSVFNGGKRRVYRLQAMTSPTLRQKFARMCACEHVFKLLRSPSFKGVHHEQVEDEYNMTVRWISQHVALRLDTRGHNPDPWTTI
jgi:hypothetical protein